MFNCDNCLNLKNCPNKDTVKKVKEDVIELSVKHSKFYGRIVLHCDYFVMDRVMKTAQT